MNFSDYFVADQDLYDEYSNNINDHYDHNYSDLESRFSNHSRMMSGGFQSDNTFHLPRDMTFTSDSLITVIFYTVLLIIGAAGNLIVFVTLFRARQRKSRVNRFIMHLCIADMTVVFIMMPLEIGWHVTVSWEAGDIACRILMFFRAFGFYLSSFILIVISLDRVFTVTHPMKLQDAEHRGKVMLILSWIMSTVGSLPQVSFSFKWLLGKVCAKGDRLSWSLPISLLV